MAPNNLDIVRAIYAAFDRGDIDAALDHGAADVEVEYHGLSFDLEGRTYRGREGARKVVETFWAPFDDPQGKLEAFVELGDHVVTQMRFTARGKASGAPVEFEIWHVWTLRDGVVVRWRICGSESDVIAAVGPLRRPDQELPPGAPGVPSA